MPLLDEVEYLKKVAESRSASIAFSPKSKSCSLYPRSLYRQTKRLLTRLSLKHWHGDRATFQRTLRAFLRPKNRSYLLRVLRSHAFAMSVLGALFTGSAAVADTPIDLETINAGSGGFVIHGGHSSDHANNNSGLKVANAGDVNNDGFDDIIIGAHRSDPNGSGSGSSYVIFGGSGNTTVDLENVEDGIGTRGFAIPGIPTGDASGFSVSGAGDVNGDGLDDVIVSSPRAYSSGEPYAGQVYIVFGKNNNTTAISLSDVLSGTGGFAVKGDANFGNLGWSVSGAGDKW